jgi:MFS family permease
VSAAVRATYAAFTLNGFAFASWASRIPAVKAKLGLTPRELGLVLLAIAAGSVLALPSSGPVVARFGSRRTVTVMAIVGGAGFLIIAAGYQLGVAVVLVGLFVMGMATGMWDVAMNVQGALVEQRLGRAIMPRFHAGFSIGTVAGALVGAGAVAVGLSVTVHLALVGVAIGVAVPFAVRSFLHDKADREHEVGRASLAAWREPRTLLVGLFVLAFAFAEGSGNDWIGVGMIDDHHTSAAVARSVATRPKRASALPPTSRAIVIAVTKTPNPTAPIVSLVP